MTYPPRPPQPPYPPQGGQPPPYPPPYYPPPHYPPPGVQPQRGGRRGWIIGGVIAGAVLVLCAVGVVGVSVFGDHVPTTATPAAATPAATPAAATNRYADPPDRCGLLDASLVESWAGKPVRNTPEQNELPDSVGGNVDGCTFDLRLDSLNTFKVFASADKDAKAKYDFAVRADKAIDSIVITPISGLGAEATSYSRQGSDKRQIQSGVVVHDADLYLEVRLIAGGTKEWDPDEVKGHLVDVARAVMDKLPKR